MSNFDLCRKNLHQRLGIEDQDKKDPSQMLSEIKRMKSKLIEIADLAKPRLVMGGIRYGSGWEHEPLMKYMQSKFDQYRKTGNFEMLVDLFNFVVIEGELKTHPNFHFKAEDRG